MSRETRWYRTTCVVCGYRRETQLPPESARCHRCTPRRTHRLPASRPYLIRALAEVQTRLRQHLRHRDRDTRSVVNLEAWMASIRGEVAALRKTVTRGPSHCGFKIPPLT